MLTLWGPCLLSIRKAALLTRYSPYFYEIMRTHALTMAALLWSGFAYSVAGSPSQNSSPPPKDLTFTCPLVTCIDCYAWCKKTCLAKNNVTGDLRCTEAAWPPGAAIGRVDCYCTMDRSAPPAPPSSSDYRVYPYVLLSMGLMKTLSSTYSLLL